MNIRYLDLIAGPAVLVFVVGWLAYLYFTHRRKGKSALEKETNAHPKTRTFAYDPIAEKYIPKEDLIKKYGPDIPVRNTQDIKNRSMKSAKISIATQIDSTSDQEKRLWMPQTIATVMLLWALYPDNPYDYYILLRIVCCAVFVYLAIRALAQDEQDWVWVLGVVAVIYNPIVRIHLTREIWSVINIVTIIVIVYSAFKLKIYSK